MKKIIIFISVIFLILCLNLNSYSSLFSSAQKMSVEDLIVKNKIELEVIWEKQFDEKIIDVFFEANEITVDKAIKKGWKVNDKKSNEMLNILYPSIKFKTFEIDGWGANLKNSTKEIIYLNSNEEIIKKITINQNNKILFSYNTEYIVISDFPDEIMPTKKGGTIYKNGNKIHKYIDSTPIAISDKGYAINTVIDWQFPPKTGTDFFLFNSRGKKIKKIENPSTKNTSALFALFCEGGDHAILCFKNTTYAPTIFKLISKNGDELWQKKFIDYRFSGRDEEIILIPKLGLFCILKEFNPEKLFLCFIDWEGNLKWKNNFDYGGNYKIQMSNDKSSIFAITTNGCIWKINANTGKEVWKYKENWTFKINEIPPSNFVNKSWFTEIEEINNYVFLIGRIPGNNLKWSGSSLYIFDSNNGYIIERQEYKGEKLLIRKKNGKILKINLTKSNLKVFQL